MKIYIDNEEVLCASKMNIKESLKNTNSVILNNVYPKSWESDKDYVSRFYMPKDYSKCKIIDENINTTSEYDLSNNINYISQRNVAGSTAKMSYVKTSITTYVRVIPGLTYEITLNNEYSSNIAFYEADSLDIGYVETRLDYAEVGRNTYTITPTKPYIVTTKSYGGANYVTIEKITTELSNNLIFSGMIKNSGNINLNPRYPHYATLQLLDYKSFLSEGDTLNYVIDNMTTLEALQYIVKDLKGFALGEVDIEETAITKYNCDNKTPYDVFEYIAEITGSIWYTKAISEDLVLINFYSTDKLEQKENIEYTPEYFVNNSIEDIQYSYNAKDYRNKQVILSDSAKAEITQTEYITYVGSNIRTTYPISEIESVTSGTNNYSITTNVGKSIGIYANIYYTYGSSEIEINNISIGKTLKITYYPVVNSRQVAYNQDEIDRISETTNRNGIIARYEKRGDTTDEKALSQISQTYLDYKGVPEVKLKVKTYYKDIFNIGDVVFFNGPLESLKTKYLVINKGLEMYTAGDQQKIFYEYELSSSFNDENAINFFDNQRRKLSGNIQEGEYISRYIDLPSQTDIIFYDLSVAETLVPGDILDGELDIELLGNSNILNGTLNLVL